jgi:hypothetical protein
VNGRVAVLVTLAVVTAAGDGWGQSKPSKDQCIEAHEAAQLGERDGKLVAAREQFRTCAHEACPALVRDECGPGLERVAARVSSVRIDARAPGDVSVDGQPLPAPAEDGSVELDPGEHVFRLRTDSKTLAEQRITLRDGEREVAVLLAPAPLVSAPSAPPPPAPTRGSPTGVYVLGGVAAAGLGTFVVLAISGRLQQSNLDDCKPSCQQSDVDDMKRTYLFADLALGVAAIAGGVAAYLHFKDKSRSERQLGAWVGAAPRPSGAELRAGVSF